MLPVPADGSKVGNLPVQAGQLEQALRHTHCLAQRQIKQTLDSQAELDYRLAILWTTAPLAAGTAVPAHVLVQPDNQRATRFRRSIVVFPVGRSPLRFCCGTHAVSLPRDPDWPLYGPFCATKPSALGSLLSKRNEKKLYVFRNP